MSDSVTERLILARQNIDAAISARDRAQYDECRSLVRETREFLADAENRIPPAARSGGEQPDDGR